jgi:hypothetical protein
MVMSRLVFAVILAGALTTVAPGAWAQKLGPEFRVNTYMASEQNSPAVARLSNGGFVVVWVSDNQDGSFDGIFGQRYDAAGAPAGSEFLINTYSTRNQTAPSVAGLSDGGFVVTWFSGTPTGAGQDGSMFGVYAQRYNAAGARAGSEFRVNTYTTDKQSFPVVAGLSAGGFVIVWQSFGQDGAMLGIYGKRFTSLGAPGREFRINATRAGFQERPSVAALTGGGFVVAWNSSDGSGSGIYARRYSSVALPISGEFPVNTYTTENQGASSVAGLHDGGFVVTWHSMGQDSSSNGVYGQRFTAAGAPAGGEFQVNSYTAGEQKRPSASGFSNGGFVVTWESNLQDGYEYGVFGRRYNAAGVPVGDEFLINTRVLFSQQNPSVAALSDRGFVATWTSYVQDSAGGGIYAQRFADPAPQITLNPVDKTVLRGGTATFSADASASPAATVQWQVRAGLKGFANISGATSKSLTFTAASLQNGNQYRAVFSNAWGNATTTAATLRVLSIR